MLKIHDRVCLQQCNQEYACNNATKENAYIVKVRVVVYWQEWSGFGVQILACTQNSHFFEHFMESIWVRVGHWSRDQISSEQSCDILGACLVWLVFIFLTQCTFAKIVVASTLPFLASGILLADLFSLLCRLNN